MPAIAAPDADGAQDLRLSGVHVERADTDGRRIVALDSADLTVPAGRMVGISGPSGAGKTTLLDVIAGIVAPDRGAVLWGATDIAGLSEGQRDRWRRRTVGFVFQDFHLVPELSVLDNVLLPLTFDRFRIGRADRARAGELVARVGLAGGGRRAGGLSRGEQQRVAIARALIRRPALILADEPTASLDEAAGSAVVDLLLQSASESGATLVVVSHDGRLLRRLPSTVSLAAGRVAGGAE